jgi:hypothetical protein
VSCPAVARLLSRALAVTPLADGPERLALPAAVRAAVHACDAATCAADEALDEVGWWLRGSCMVAAW